MQIYGRLVHMLERTINVPVSGISPTPGSSVILFAAKVGPRFSEQIHRLVEAAQAIRDWLNGRMIVEIFVVEDRRLIDFMDGSLHFVVRFNHVARHIRFLSDAQQKLSGAQIAAGMQIGRMAAGHLRVDGKCHKT
jgi:hypothetical protein